MSVIDTIEGKVMTEGAGLDLKPSKNLLDAKGEITLAFRLSVGSAPGAMFVVSVCLVERDGTRWVLTEEETKRLLGTLKFLPEARALRVVGGTGWLMRRETVAGDKVSNGDDVIWVDLAGKASEMLEASLTPTGLVMRVADGQYGFDGTVVVKAG
jgi:hypothetical protein